MSEELERMEDRIVSRIDRLEDKLESEFRDFRDDQGEQWRSISENRARITRLAGAFGIVTVLLIAIMTLGLKLAGGG